MLLQQDDDYTAISSSVEDTIAMGVSNPALIFQMLCNKIYGFPLRTTVQEYMANARDAHREVGREDRAVRVALPNSLSPTLTITDYGPGISPDSMANVFACIGESTKRGDNIQHGGWGIGAKVGFAYSDIFYITSRYNGTSTEYMAYIGSDRLGYIDKLSSRPYAQEEGDGVTIKVPIRESDFDDVAAALLRCTYFWKVRPIVTNAPPSLTKLFDRYHPCSDNTGVFSLSPVLSPELHSMITGEGPKPLIVVDGIIYGTVSEERLPDICDKLLPNSVLNFGVGELDLSISREGVQYTEHTMSAIRETVYTGTQNDDQTALSDFLHLVDPYSLQNTISNVLASNSGVSSVASSAVSAICWGNFDLEYRPSYLPTNGLLRLKIPKGWTAYRTSRSDIRYGWATPSLIRSGYIVLNSELKYIVDDRATENISSIMLKRMADEDSKDNIYIILKPSIVHQTLHEAKHIWAEFLEAVGGTYLSQYEKTKKRSTVRSRSSRAHNKTCVFTVGRSNRGGRKAEPSSIDALFGQVVMGHTVVVAYKGRSYSQTIEECFFEARQTQDNDISFFLVNDRSVLDWLVSEDTNIITVDKLRHRNLRYRRNTNYEYLKKFAECNRKLNMLEYQYGPAVGLSIYGRYSEHSLRLDNEVLDAIDVEEVKDPYLKLVLEYRRLLADLWYLHRSHVDGSTTRGGMSTINNIVAPNNRSHPFLADLYLDAYHEYPFLWVLGQRRLYGDMIQKTIESEIVPYINMKYKESQYVQQYR